MAMKKRFYSVNGQMMGYEEGGVKKDFLTDHLGSITAEIDAALKLGKITPATADYHRAACQEEGGLDRFKAFVTAAPVVGEPSGLGAQHQTQTRTALNAEQQAMCKQFDVDPEQYLKTLQSEG